MDLIIANKASILGILWLVSEVLGSNESIKANSIFQLVKALLGKFVGK